jgi:hypothetical protein
LGFYLTLQAQRRRGREKWRDKVDKGDKVDKVDKGE